MAFVLQSIENFKPMMEDSHVIYKQNVLKKNMKIFVDIKNFQGKLEQLDINLKKLQITREEFLIKDVNYIVCNKFYNTLELTYPVQPKKEFKLPSLSRGHTLLQRSNSASTFNNLTDPLKFAKAWNIPIISPEELNVFIKSAFFNKKNRRISHKNKNLIRYFKGLFIKFEDNNKSFAPIFKSFNQFPTISFFNKKFDINFDDLNISNIKIEITKTFTNFDEIDKTNFNKEKNEKLNFCECCEKLFEEDVTKHIITSLHKRFVQVVNNYIPLDNIISNMKKLNELNDDEQLVVMKIKEEIFANEYLDSDFVKIASTNNANDAINIEPKIPSPNCNVPLFDCLNIDYLPTIILTKLFNSQKNLNFLKKESVDLRYFSSNKFEIEENILNFTDYFYFNDMKFSYNNLCDKNIIDAMGRMNLFNKKKMTFNMKNILNCEINKHSLTLENNCMTLFEKHDNFHDFLHNQDLYQFDKLPPLLFEYKEDKENTNNNLNNFNNIHLFDSTKQSYNGTIGFNYMNSQLDKIFMSCPNFSPFIFLNQSYSNSRYSKSSPAHFNIESQDDVCRLNSVDENINADCLQSKNINILNKTVEPCECLNENSNLDYFINLSTTNSNFKIENCKFESSCLTNHIPDERLKKMNETIQSLWTSTYITDLKIKLSKISK